jgi:glycosyltransferase involved in cell wall biosynthesis
VVLPHGIVVRKPQPATADSASFTVGSFGFLLPHKNIDTLVLAFAAARRYCPKLRLKLFHAVKATDESRWQRAVVETLIGNLALSDCVSASFNFIPEHELIEQLATCDLLVFPYRSSTETASGAARIALGVDRPILCSRSTPLRDLWRVSHVLKNDHVECLTEALVSLAQSDDLLKAFDRDRRIMIDRNSYERIAVRHVHHLEEMLGGTGDIRKAA